MRWTLGQIAVRALALLCGAAVAIIFANATGVLPRRRSAVRVEPRAIALSMTPSEMRVEIERVRNREVGEREASKGRIIESLSRMASDEDAGSGSKLRACVEEARAQPIEALLPCINLY